MSSTEESEVIVKFGSKLRHHFDTRDPSGGEDPGSLQPAQWSQVRILRDEEELREAFDRAASFERRIVAQFKSRMARYEHQDMLG